MYCLKDTLCYVWKYAVSAFHGVTLQEASPLPLQRPSRPSVPTVSMRISYSHLINLTVPCTKRSANRMCEFILAKRRNTGTAGKTLTSKLKIMFVTDIME